MRVGSAAALGSATTTVNVLSGATLDLFGNKVAPVIVTLAGDGVGGMAAALADTSALGTSSAVRGNVGGIILSADASIMSLVNTYPTLSGPGSSFQGNGKNLTVFGGGEWDFYDCGETHLANITLRDSPTYFGSTTTLGDSPGVITLQNTGGLGLDGSAPVTKNIVIDNVGSSVGLITSFNNNNLVNSQITLNGNLDATVYCSTNGQNRVLTLAGKLTGPGSLTAHLNANATASRVGTVELVSNDNDYLGTTTIGGGGGPYSSVQAANDRITLSIGNGGTTGKLGAGDVFVVASVNYLQFNRNDVYTVPNNISGGGNLIMIAPSGDVTLTGPNSYQGTTAINAGTVRINGDSSGATGPFSIGSGAVLRGSGIVGGPVTVNGTGTIRGGNSIGTLTLNATLEVAPGGSIFVEIAGGNPASGPGTSTIGTLPNPTSNNYLNITSSATIDPSATVIVNVAGLTTYNVPYSYQIAQSASDQSGLNINLDSQFTFNVSVISGATSLTGDATGAIYLNFTPTVPEPASLLGLTALGFAIWRRIENVKMNF